MHGLKFIDFYHNFFLLVGDVIIPVLLHEHNLSLSMGVIGAQNTGSLAASGDGLPKHHLKRHIAAPHRLPPSTHMPNY